MNIVSLIRAGLVLPSTDDRDEDIPAALKKWPLLKGYTIAPAIATTVRTGAW